MAAASDRAAGRDVRDALARARRPPAWRAPPTAQARRSGWAALGRPISEPTSSASQSCGYALRQVVQQPLQCLAALGRFGFARRAPGFVSSAALTAFGSSLAAHCDAFPSGPTLCGAFCGALLRGLVVLLAAALEPGSQCSSGGRRASSNIRSRSAARPPGGSGVVSPGRFMVGASEKSHSNSRAGGREGFLRTSTSE